MDSFKNYFKKLLEDRVILAKEDGDGGAPAGGGGDGGEVSAPAGDGGASADASDVLPPGMKPNTSGLSTTDVFGKCDHRKDGVFGPGCFHLPCIWTVPSYRLPRKKKRKLKYANIVNEQDDFQLFDRDVKHVIDKEMD